MGQAAEGVASRVAELEAELAQSWGDNAHLASGGGLVEHLEVELTDLLLRLEPLAPEQSAAMRRKVRGVGERLATAKAKCLG